jgi:hypothetical protein
METKYKNYKIALNELDDTWRCEELDIGPLEKLSGVKKRIDDLSKADRRINVDCWMIEERFGRRNEEEAKIKKVTVTILCEARARSSYDSRPPVIEDCWVVDSKKERSKVSLHSLFALDCKDDLQRALRAKREATEAMREADKMLDALPRCDADMLALAAKEKVA